MVPCPACGTELHVDVYPALLRKDAPPRSGERLLVEDEASCFYHPTKKAAVPCALCGRFLCSLCDVEFDGRHLCPSCLESGKKKQRIANLDNYRVLYDNIALALAVFPMLLWPFTFVTAPVAMFVTLRYWRAPSSLVPRTKIRFVLASLLAGLQVAGWTSLIVMWIA
jgi:hypothetical protein